jgi:hypothetical protein
MVMLMPIKILCFSIVHRLLLIPRVGGDYHSNMPRCGGEDPVAVVWLDSRADLDGSTAEHPLHLPYFCRIT